MRGGNRPSPTDLRRNQSHWHLILDFWAPELREQIFLLFMLLSGRCVCSHFSRVQLFGSPWTAARQAPLSLGFSRQEYWSGLPFPPPEDLPELGTEPMCLMSPTRAGRFFKLTPVCGTWTTTLANDKASEDLCRPVKPGMLGKECPCHLS